MARQTIVTTSPGDSAKDGGDKINANFLEIYTALMVARSAGKVLAGPVSGADAVPTFRLLQATDVPDLSSVYQPYSSALATYAGIAPSANVQSLLGAANYGAMRTLLALVIGTNVQAWAASLDTWATKTAPSGVVAGLTDAQTLTNKRVNKRVVTVSYAADVAVNSDSADGAVIGTLTGDIAVTISGTPTADQELLLRFRQDGTGGRAIDLGTNVQYSVDIPEADIPDGANEVFKLLLIWDATLSKWIASALNQIL